MSKARPAYKGPERRGTQRKVRGFHADIVRVNELTFQSKWYNEVGTDISNKGLGLRCSRPLPEKSHVTIAIVLRDGGYHLLKVEARLVWISKVVEHQKERFFMGFEFTKLDPEIREKIQQFLRDDC